VPSDIAPAVNPSFDYQNVAFDHPDVAVALIALTGTINTLLLVGSLGPMFGTPYGRLLALKILLFLAMVLPDSPLWRKVLILSIIWLLLYH
jgi:hypothetical protein